MSLNQDLRFNQKVLNALIQETRKYKGLTSPNPCVGAAVYQNNQEIATGFHQGPGTDHAEVIALKKAGNHAKNSTLYITLEPCTHWGKTPPCINAIIEAGVSTVVYAIADSNPTIRKNPAKPLLEAAGINVYDNVAKEAGQRLLQEYLYYQGHQKPFFHLKAGLSLDGKIAMKNGESKYITGQESQKKVHLMRRESDAILVGVGTVNQDNPQLNVRFNYLRKNEQNPKVIVLDKNGSLQKESYLRQESRSIFITNTGVTYPFSMAGTQIEIPFTSTHEFWQKLQIQLYKETLQNILIEGGQKIFTDAIDSKIVNQIHLFYAPVLLRQKEAMSVLSSNEQLALKDKLQLKNTEVTQLDQDIYISGQPGY